MEDLPAGQYAIAIFHDKNGDEQLDTNWLGIPKEPLGFSNARMRTFGPPSFQECVVSLEKDAIIKVLLE